MEGDKENLKIIDSEYFIQKLDDTPERFRNRKSNFSKEISVPSAECELEDKIAEIELLKEKNRESKRIIESLLSENKGLTERMQKLQTALLREEDTNLEVIEEFYWTQTKRQEKLAKHWEKKAQVLAGKYYQILTKMKKGYSELKNSVISLNELHSKITKAYF